LYLYNDDRSIVFGPYTSVDNWDGTNVTPIMTGEAITLEYFVPANQQDIGDLSVMRVLHGYRHMFDHEARERDALDGFGDAIPCMININCFPEYQDEKNSVALIAMPGGGLCTGTMLNNTTQNGDPLFLTANHCLNGNESNWLFYFNYESPNCSPTTDGMNSHVISNATLLMAHPPSDHALLRLSRSRPATNFIPRYEGWYNGPFAPQFSFGIHHPAGDVKKAHQDFQPATSDDWNGDGPDTHWLTHPDVGITEPGSSGSALFDENHHVVGPLHGGDTDCDPETENDKLYGKMSVAWNGGGTPSTSLRNWLDPINTLASDVDAIQPVSPANDSCDSPNVPLITTLPYSTTGSTMWANHDMLLNDCSVSTAPDVVYNLELNCWYDVTVSLCGSSFDTQLYVLALNGICTSELNLEACNDDFCGTQSQVSFRASPNWTYSIWVTGFGSAYGNYVLNITGTANSYENATCPGQAVTEVPFSTFSDTECSGDHYTPSCQSNDAEDVVYSFVSPYNQRMRARTCAANFDTILELREQAPCPGFYATACSDDAPCGTNPWASEVVFDAVAGRNYYFHIDGYGGQTGITTFDLTAANDDCSSPFVVTELPWSGVGDTRSARDDFDTALGWGSKEVFYQFTSPTCRNMGVMLCFGTSFDTYLEVRTGGPCPGSTIVASNDDYCGVGSRAEWSAEANRTYYIIVTGFNADQEGAFEIDFFPLPGTPPAPYGDICETSLQIPSLPFADYGNTCCMADNYNPCVGPNSREVVYQFSSPTCQVVTVSLCGSGYDTGLGIYGGSCPDLSQLIVCNDDNYCGDNYVLQSTAIFTAQPNTNYQFLVHGFNANCGNYVLNVSGIPCAAPTPDPVDDLVIRPLAGSNDVQLHWTPTVNATTYQVYYSANQNSIVAPANLLVTVPFTDVSIGGVLGNPETMGFFQVVAVGADGAGLAVSIGDERPKSEAINSVEIQNPHQFMTNEVEEQADKNGK